MQVPSNQDKSNAQVTDAQIKGEPTAPTQSASEKIKQIIPYWLAFTGKQDKDLEVQTRIPRIALLTALIVLTVFITWAYLAELDQVTRATGKVIVSSKSQVVQSLDGGVLDVLLVKEGDMVQAQQVLAQLDRTKLEAAYLEAKAKVISLQINLQRLNAEMTDKPFIPSSFSKDFPEFQSNQKVLIEKRRLALKEEIFTLTNMLELAQKELDMNRPLLDRGDISQVDLLRIQRQVI